MARLASRSSVVIGLVNLNPARVGLTWLMRAVLLSGSFTQVPRNTLFRIDLH